MTGAIAYPEPEKGYLDQDAELMLAIEVLEECYAIREAEEERRKALKEEATRRFSVQS